MLRNIDLELLSFVGKFYNENWWVCIDAMNLFSLQRISKRWEACIDGKSLQNSQTWLCFRLYLSLFVCYHIVLHTLGICKPSAHDKNKITGGSKFWTTFCHSQVGGYGCPSKVDEPWRSGHLGLVDGEELELAQPISSSLPNLFRDASICRYGRGFGQIHLLLALVMWFTYFRNILQSKCEWREYS